MVTSQRIARFGGRAYEHGRTNYTPESHTETMDYSPFSRCTTVAGRYTGYVK